MRIWPVKRKIIEEQLDDIPVYTPIRKELWKKYRSNEYEIQIYRKATLPANDMILTYRCHEWDAYDGKLKWTLYDLDQEGIVKSAGSCNDWGYYLVHRVEKCNVKV